MKIALTIVGVVAVLLGALWILQGLNVIPIGFMAGKIMWTGWGAFLLMGGAITLVWAQRGTWKR
ncbi:MAG: hypothetical protein ACHP84_17410 [Caulobacterales bacterium]